MERNGIKENRGGEKRTDWNGMEWNGMEWNKRG